MQDPLPENIDGEKVVTHSVEHEINWGYVSVAVMVLVLLWYLDPLNRLGESTEDEMGPTNSPS